VQARDAALKDMARLQAKHSKAMVQAEEAQIETRAQLKVTDDARCRHRCRGCRHNARNLADLVCWAA
jgi:hypothetical protein